MKLRGLSSALLGGLLSAGVAIASTPSQSVRPVARPAISLAEPVTASAGNAIVGTEAEAPRFAVFLTDAPGLRQSLRPEVRPDIRVSSRSFRAPQTPASAALTRSVLPQTRPENLHRRNSVVAAGFTRTKPANTLTRSRKGSICGSKTIKGVALSPIKGRMAGCGQANPVQITSIDGVALSQAATMDCTTANALEAWVKNGVKPTVGRLGGGVGSLQVVAHYSCRTRNSKKGAKISEHGKGHAIDISAVNLKNGVSITVKKGWGDPTQGKLLRTMHASACGPFGTVLGPKSDRHHQDHFHLDTARYRSGSYCR